MKLILINLVLLLMLCSEISNPVSSVQIDKELFGTWKEGNNTLIINGDATYDFNHINGVQSGDWYINNDSLFFIHKDIISKGTYKIVEDTLYLDRVSDYYIIKHIYIKEGYFEG